MKTLLLQHDIVWEDKAENHLNVERLLDGARPEPGTLVVLPELFDTGFSMNLDRIVDDRTAIWAADTARTRGIRLLAGHAEIADDGRGRNAVTMFGDDGAALATYRKVHPFSFGREADHYGGGSHCTIISIDGVRVAPMICYDLRFPELWRLAARSGAEVFAMGANWPAARQSHWRALCIARAIENQAFVLAVNRVGSDPKIRYVGGSMIVDPKGNVIAEARDDETALAATLDIDALRAWRREFPALADVRDGLLGSISTDVVTESPRPRGETAPDH